MGFRLVPKLVTLNDLERRNDEMTVSKLLHIVGQILRFFAEFGTFTGRLRQSGRT